MSPDESAVYPPPAGPELVMSVIKFVILGMELLSKASKKSR